MDEYFGNLIDTIKTRYYNMRFKKWEDISPDDSSTKSLVLAIEDLNRRLVAIENTMHNWEWSK